MAAGNLFCFPEGGAMALVCNFFLSHIPDLFLIPTLTVKFGGAQMEPATKWEKGVTLPLGAMAGYL